MENGNKRWTYFVNIENLENTFNNFEKTTRYSIRKCQQKVKRILKPTDYYFTRFDELHKSSRPDRKINKDFIIKTFNDWSPNCCLYFTKTACTMISWDKEEYRVAKGYYLLAGRNTTIKPDGSPSKILWEAMKDLNEKDIMDFDMCGCNVPSVALFKRGFGGKKTLQKTPCLVY